MNIKAKGETSMLLKKALSLIPKEFPNSNREAAVSQHLKFVSFNKYSILPNKRVYTFIWEYRVEKKRCT